MSTISVLGFTTADIIAAANLAGAGGTVFFPNGTYTVVGLQSTFADQTWQLERYAVLQKPATSDTNQILLNLANGLRIRGGTLKDTLSNATAHGICSDGFSIDLEDVKIVDARGWGIYTRNADFRMKSVEVHDSLHGGVLHSATVTQQGPQLDGVRVYRTDPAKYGDSGGLHIQGSGSGVWMKNVRIANCHTELPVGTGANAVGIELWQAWQPYINGNDTVDGRIGHSFATCQFGRFISNFSWAPADYAYEMASVSFCDLSHNTGRGYGPGLNYGVELSNGSAYNNVTDNRLVGFGTNVFQTTDCHDNTIR